MTDQPKNQITNDTNNPTMNEQPDNQPNNDNQQLRGHAKSMSLPGGGRGVGRKSDNHCLK